MLISVSMLFLCNVIYTVCYMLQGFRGEKGREGPPGPDGKPVSINQFFNTSFIFTISVCCQQILHMMESIYVFSVPRVKMGNLVNLALLDYQARR